MTYILVMLTLWPVDGKVYLSQRSNRYTQEQCEFRKVREVVQEAIGPFGRPLVLHSYCVRSHVRGLSEGPST